MNKVILVWLNLLLVLSGCLPVEKSVNAACPAIGLVESLRVDISLLAPISDFTLTINGDEINQNCPSAFACLNFRRYQNGVLTFVVNYPRDLPEVIDLTLRDSAQDLLRHESFANPVVFPAPGSDVGSVNCPLAREGRVSLQE
jgi:hypothetical protein